METLRRILLVDDNPDDRELVSHELRKELGEVLIQEICEADELKAALETEFDLVITDYHLGWSNGLAILRAIKARYPHCPVIMFTGTGSEEIAVEAMKSGLEDYVLKSPNHLVRLVAIVKSTLQRTASTARANELERRLHHLLDRLNVGVFRATIHGLILEANPALLKLLGWHQLPPDVHLRELYLRPEIHSEHLHQLKQAGELRDFKVELCRTDGSTVLVSLSQSLTHERDGEAIIEGLVEDISEHTRVEAQLRQTQKLESVARLAAGVAHDFNNVLTIIQGYAGLLAQKDFDADTSFGLKSILSASERAAMLTRQLLAFGRSQTMRPQVMDLNQLIRGLCGLTRHVLGDRVMLEVHCARDLPLVRADENMLSQLLTNLAMNARDAMPEGGKFLIRTEPSEIEARNLRANVEARPGTFVRLTVADTGCGISPEHLAHLFEPFFTTKDVGKGTGLGLAAVYGIVKQHKGWIEVDSQPGSATAFQIYFPAEPHAIAGPPAFTSVRPETSRTVLLVEDEPELLSLVSEILQASGYRVLPAASGRTALQLWKESRQNIDLLVTDMKMPGGMGGLELARVLVSENPSLKVLYTSGYSPDLLQPDIRLREGLNYLQKPYPPERLLSAIRNCLHSSSNKGSRPDESQSHRSC